MVDPAERESQWVLYNPVDIRFGNGCRRYLEALCADQPELKLFLESLRSTERGLVR